MRILLMYAPSAEHRAALEAAAPGAELLTANDEATAKELIAEADAVLGNRYFLQSLPYARRLKWMQSISAGVDRILLGGVDLGNLVITCARGVYDDEMAEHTLALALTLTRGLHRAMDNQRLARWERMALPTLSQLHCLVLGWGSLGRAIAGRLRAQGAQVEGARRREEPASIVDDRGFTVWGGRAWRRSLPGVQLLILALPLTQQTRHLVGAAELALLPRGAFLVNVGRGGTLDEAALLEALDGRRLAGAALDVCEQEPLPPQHPLWRVPNLLVTPHVARSQEQAPYRWEPLFEENVRRFARNEPLINVVDRQAGY